MKKTLLRNPNPNALAWLLASLLVIAADQLSKYWVLTSLPEFTAVPVVEGWWHWYRSYNTGAAFSLLSDAGGWQQHLLVSLALCITGSLGYWLRQTRTDAWNTALPYALVIGVLLRHVLDRRMRAHSSAGGREGKECIKN